MKHKGKSASTGHGTGALQTASLRTQLARRKNVKYLRAKRKVERRQERDRKLREEAERAVQQEMLKPVQATGSGVVSE